MGPSQCSVGVLDTDLGSNKAPVLTSAPVLHTYREAGRLWLHILLGFAAELSDVSL